MTDRRNARTGEMDRLFAELGELRREVAALRADNVALHAAQPAQASLPSGDTPTTRRGVLRLAGAAALGAATAATTGIDRAAAVNGDPMQVGFIHPTDHRTKIVYGTGAKADGGAFDGSTNSLLTVDCFNVVNSVGVSADGGRWGVIGTAKEGAGVASYGLDYGFSALSSRKADFVFGLLTPGTNAPKTAPPSRTDSHIRGEMDADADGNLWFCIAGGTPGTWQRLAGPGATPVGLFRPIGPFRVYDSRMPLPMQGPIGAGMSRVVSVADARNVNTGAVTTSGVVPPGATAIACNIAVVNTQNAGFVTINPGGDVEIRSASVNWFASGQVLNNGIIVKISASREITAIVGPGTATDLIVDVTGYFI